MKGIVCLFLAICQWIFLAIGAFLLGKYLYKLIHTLAISEMGVVDSFIWFHRPGVLPLGEYPPWWAYITPWAFSGAPIAMAFALRSLRKWLMRRR